MIDINSTHYFDTNALIKYYTEQDGRLNIRRLVSTCKAPLLVSHLTILEFIGVMMKYFRKKLLKKKELNSIVKRVRRDCKLGLSNRPFQIIQIDSQYYREAQGILLQHASQFAIESNDALHLATILSHSRSIAPTIFITSDHSLKKTSSLKAILCYDPELE